MVWPVSLLKSTLQASSNGVANVAPLPLSVAANAGEDEAINAEAAITATANFFLESIIPPCRLSEWQQPIRGQITTMDFWDNARCRLGKQIVYRFNQIGRLRNPLSASLLD